MKPQLQSFKPHTGSPRRTKLTTAIHGVLGDTPGHRSLVDSETTDWAEAGRAQTQGLEKGQERNRKNLGSLKTRTLASKLSLAHMGPQGLSQHVGTVEHKQGLASLWAHRTLGKRLLPSIFWSSEARLESIWLFPAHPIESDHFVDKNTWFHRRPSAVSGVWSWGHIWLRETKEGRLGQ